MEPRQSEESLESGSQVQTSPTRHPERKRRFRIVKLEERIAPGRGGPQPAYKTGFCYFTEKPCWSAHNNCK
jgi:hypothetical protein